MDDIGDCTCRQLNVHLRLSIGVHLHALHRSLIEALRGRLHAIGIRNQVLHPVVAARVGLRGDGDVFADVLHAQAFCFGMDTVVGVHADGALASCKSLQKTRQSWT
jgi:hypothetical protein